MGKTSVRPDDLAVTRCIVFELEKKMLQLPQVEMETRHHFSKGVYARELHIPKDTILTGAIHKHQNLNILSQGEISVLTEDGVKRIKAPFTVVSPAGIKRIAYAHEDCVWTTIFPTDETDAETIVDLFTTNDDMEFLELQKQLEGER